MDGERGVLSLEAAGGLDVSVVGAKAASLVQLARLDLRVPPAFVVTTDVWRAHRRDGGLPDDVVDAVDREVAGLEQRAGRRFGGAPDPLLVSVRSGAAASMPGMLDTVLDVGFGPGTRSALAADGGEPFAERCHRRFLAGWATTVLHRPTEPGASADELVALLGDAVPSDPHEQLRQAIAAVLRSWDNDRARSYREHRGIDHGLGTAVVVQAMVFGDRGPASGTGVAFSRDPDTGAPGLCGDFLPGAQGSDVVDGRRDTRPVAALGEVSVAALTELEAAVATLEAATGDMVDVEFTVEDGVLHLLQHRPGPRAAAAAVRIAVDLVDAGTITLEEARRRVSPAQLAHASRPAVAASAPDLLGTGTGACPGVATGQICLSPEHVADHDGPVVLVRSETSPDDVQAMTASAGLVTAHGGLVSHAALVARELDLPAVVGLGGLVIDDVAGTATIGSVVLREGDVVSLDGSSGRVHLGAAPVVPSAPGPHLERFRAWIAGADGAGGGGPRPG